MHSASAVANLSVCHSVRCDYNDKDPSYVLGLATTNVDGNVAVAAALSNHKTKVYSYDGASLTHAGDLTGHQATIQSVGFLCPSAPSTLFTSSSDGTVRSWDLRSMQCVETFKGEGEELFCCSVGRGEQAVAAGSVSGVLFWDRRTRRINGKFGDSFADAVTQVKFHPGSDNTLITGDIDGLCCIFDTSKKLSEDSAFRACANIGTSVAELGVYAPRGERLWARSTTESLHLWHWAAALDEEGMEGAGESRLEDARGAAGQQAAASGLPALAQVDYLIGCEYSPAQDRLYMLAGTAGGAVGVFPVAEAEGAAAPVVGPPVATLQGGHESIIRSVLWPMASGTAMVTGAEDSRVCAWSANPVPAAPAGSGGSLGKVKGPPKKEGKGRVRPY